MSSFLSDYQGVFTLQTRSVLPQATLYLEGLFQTERTKRNIERMSEETSSLYGSQHHFITNSPWSAADLMKQISCDTNALFGDAQQQSLSIDESSFKKAGKNSVGVSRQYNGNTGKLDNSQTGVYASLSCGNKVSIINTKLFLPKEWVEDPSRCAKAGIPKQALVYKTKIELATELIKETVRAGVKFGWVGADSMYGNSYDFCKGLDEMNLPFVVDIRKDQPVYLTKPEIYIPEKKGTKGRKRTKPTCDLAHWEVHQYLKTLRNTDFQEVKIRKGTKGWIKAKVHIIRVWIWDNEEMEARERTLIIQKPHNKKDHIRYSLSNIPLPNKTVQQFAFMQAQRFWIEKAFWDQKGELGMGDYQIRKYQAWYHHQALVMLALLYINKQKILHQENIPLLSVRDIRLQLIALLKKQGVYLENEIEKMIVRHNQRAYDIERYYPDDQYF